MKKKLLITGSSGFVGRHLVNFLLKNKKYHVSVVVRPSTILPKQIQDLEASRIFTYDGSTKNLINIMGLVKPNVVVHLASKFVAEHTSDQIIPMIKSNILYSAQLLEAMSINKVKSLINTSTSWQHFENQSYNPVNFYASTKSAAERLMLYYSEAHKVKIINLKLFDTYGPYDERKKLISSLFENAFKGEVLSMSPGKQLIDMVYIDDVINAFQIAIDRVSIEKNRFSDYSVSSKKLISLKDLVKTFNSVTKLNLRVNFGSRPYRIREVMLPWTNGVGLPQWSAKINLETGLLNTLTSYRKF